MIKIISSSRAFYDIEGYSNHRNKSCRQVNSRQGSMWALRQIWTCECNDHSFKKKWRSSQSVRVREQGSIRKDDADKWIRSHYPISKRVLRNLQANPLANRSERESSHHYDCAKLDQSVERLLHGGLFGRPWQSPRHAAQGARDEANRWRLETKAIGQAAWEVMRQSFPGLGPWKRMWNW